MCDLAALEAALAGTIFAGKLHFAPSTGSTNADALQAARGGHTWISAAGEGLYVSVLLRPEFPAARLPLLPLAAGLAAADAVRAVAGLAIDLRWPNDLLIGPRKLGGILVEAKIGSQSLPCAVVGIGINVHQRAFSPGLATPATSLDLESGVPGGGPPPLGRKTGARIARLPLLAALLKSLQREVAALADPAGAKAIPARVELASTWVRGRRVQVHGPQACTGVTAGLDGNGFLRVETGEGVVTVRTGGLREAEKG
jgi:BirA family transcriptional regulator, biotin operon repressor / biotin---[acetyl-CoA-carboxylase] ligase